MKSLFRITFRESKSWMKQNLKDAAYKCTRLYLFCQIFCSIYSNNFWLKNEYTRKWMNETNRHMNRCVSVYLMLLRFSERTLTQKNHFHRRGFFWIALLFGWIDPSVPLTYWFLFNLMICTHGGGMIYICMWSKYHTYIYITLS